MAEYRTEADSPGKIEAPRRQALGRQTQWANEHFSIATDWMPRKLITAVAPLKKAPVRTNLEDKRLMNINDVISSPAGQALDHDQIWKEAALAFGCVNADVRPCRRSFQDDEALRCDGALSP